jgi:hypothetical protein
MHAWPHQNVWSNACVGFTLILCLLSLPLHYSLRKKSFFIGGESPYAHLSTQIHITMRSRTCELELTMLQRRLDGSHMGRLQQTLGHFRQYLGLNLKLHLLWSLEMSFRQYLGLNLKLHMLCRLEMSRAQTLIVWLPRQWDFKHSSTCHKCFLVEYCSPFDSHFEQGWFTLTFD